jgi:serine/threonine protein kinase
VAPRVQLARGVNAGQVLDDRFLLVEEIGHGGMSTVFRAEDLHDDRRSVVVKVPLPVFSSGVGSWSIFQREEEIGLKLDHPFVLKFLALPGPARQRSYVATEFVAGKTLHRRLRDEHPLPEPEALRIGSQICEAVAHLHERGFVHYDIKPGNVMICPDGSIRLIDFGLAHDVVTRRFTLAAQAPAIGSAEYVAPEQIRRRRGRTSADVYSIGAILYTMLTGRAPFPDDDPFVVASARTLGDPPAPRTVNPAISRQAEEIALRALRRDPTERYPSADAMRGDLDDPSRVAVTGLCDRLQPVTFGRRARRIVRQILLVGVLPVATQVLLFVALWHHYAHRH